MLLFCFLRVWGLLNLTNTRLLWSVVQLLNQFSIECGSVNGLSLILRGSATEPNLNEALFNFHNGWLWSMVQPLNQDNLQRRLKVNEQVEGLAEKDLDEGPGAVWHLCGALLWCQSNDSSTNDSSCKSINSTCSPENSCTFISGRGPQSSLVNNNLKLVLVQSAEFYFKCDDLATHNSNFWV